MDYNKACEEIFSHLFTDYLHKQVPSFMISLEEDCLYQFGIIPKDNLSPEFCQKLLTNIQLKGPTGQTHEVRTKSYGNAIFLAKGWGDFISCYSLKSSDALVFFYEGNNIFRVNIFYQKGSDITEPRGGVHPFVLVGLNCTKEKGKQIAEDEASSELMLKRGPIKQKGTQIGIDSEESRGSVKVKKQTTLEHMEISNRSGKILVQLSNDSDMPDTRNAASAGDGPKGGRVGNKKDASVEFSSACSSTGMGENNIVSSSSWEESWSWNSVHEIVAKSPLQKEVVSISSDSFHENGDEVKGQCLQILQAKEELDNSQNSDTDQVTTRKLPKSRFISSLKPIANKETRPITSQLAAQFRSQNPYFLKKIVESNVRTICRLNVLLDFGIKNLLPKHSNVILRLPQGSGRWRVNCRYSSQRPQWFFGKGWLAFTRDNNIKVGDWCVFELTCKKKHKMKVHIFREDS